MPIFNPGGPSDSQRHTTGDLPFDATGGPRLESAVPSNYALEAQGVTTESAVAIRVVDAGEVINTQRGDYIAVQDTRVRDDGTVEAYDYKQYDAGQIVTVGEEQPTTVVLTTESAPDPHYNASADITFTSGSAQTAFGGPLLPEQTDPQGGNVTTGTSFGSDPGAVTDGIASAVATLNTGDDEEEVT